MIKKRKLIQLKPKDIPRIREKQWKKQGKKCAILKKEIKLKEAVLDHKHKKKKEKVGIGGKGLLRGVLHNQCNSLEGIILKKYKKQGVHNLIDLPSYLRNLADYLENPPMKPIYIHPNERPKPKKLGKRDYNRIKKYYFKIKPKARKIPQYPKSGRLTKKWIKLLDQVNKIHFKKKKK